MEAFMAFRVPKSTVFLAVCTLMNLTSTAAISIGFVAIGTIVVEASVVRAVLPADRTDSAVVLLTLRVAEGSILLLALRAG